MCRLPSFAYHAFSRMLQKSGKSIELMSDPDMFNFVSRAKRGGLTQVSCLSLPIIHSHQSSTTNKLLRVIKQVMGSRLHGAPGSERLMSLLQPALLKYARDGGILPMGKDPPQTDIGEEKEEQVRAEILEEARSCLESGRYFGETLNSAEVQELSNGQGWHLLYLDATKWVSHMYTICNDLINVLPIQPLWECNVIAAPVRRLRVLGEWRRGISVTSQLLRWSWAITSREEGGTTMVITFQRWNQRVLHRSGCNISTRTPPLDERLSALPHSDRV